MQKEIQKEIVALNYILELYKINSRSKAKEYFKRGEVYCNGKKFTNFNQVFMPGDKIDIQKSIPTDENAPFQILYEDKQFILVIKPAGVVSAGEVPKGTNIFWKLVDKYFRSRFKNPCRVLLVHRLDKEVAGIMIFAKSHEMQEYLKNNWGSVSKIYYALSSKKPAQSEGILENWLEEGDEQKMMIVENPLKDEKLAVLKYKVVRSVKQNTLFEIQLETGRKHQIRLQLANIGCPIIGDRKYGSDHQPDRQIRLFAAKFAFDHPILKKRISVEVKLPNSFFQVFDENEDYKNPSNFQRKYLFDLKMMS